MSTYTFSSVTSNHTIGVDFRDQYEIRGTIQPFNARTGEGGNGKWKVTGSDLSGGSYDSGRLNHNERLVIPCDVLLNDGGVQHPGRLGNPGASKRHIKV